MPHIIVKKKELVKLPIKINNYEYKFYASSKNFNQLTMLGVEFENKKFLLEIKKRNNNYLIKYDKYTRLSPVKIIKDAVRYFSEINNFQTISGNISTKHDRHYEKYNDILKDINFFENDFNYKDKIQIEIGFGSGKHLLYQAEKFPDVLFLGLEIHKASIDQVIKLIKIKNLNNIFLTDIDARLFIEILKSDIIEKIYLHFPVPWDNNTTRRVVNKDFIIQINRILKKNGIFEIRTDSENYFNYCKQIFNELKLSNLKITKNEDIDIKSKYEIRWEKQNKSIYNIVFQKTDSDNFIKKNNSENFKFDFPEKYNIKTFNQLENKKITVKEYFIKFYNIFYINDNEFIMKISFGNYINNETKYLYFHDNKITYYPVNPVRYSVNKIIHERLKELFSDSM